MWHHARLEENASFRLGKIYVTEKYDCSFSRTIRTKRRVSDNRRHVEEETSQPDIFFLTRFFHHLGFFYVLVLISRAG